jgi:hypothetical protein
MRACYVALLWFAPIGISAQTVTRIPLKPASVSLDADFVGITSLREVADGRVIVTDGRDQALYVADFKRNTASLLGRKGKGPNEWLNVGFVFALTGDSSIMADFGNQRWLLFHGANIVATVPPDHPGVRASPGFVSGIDRFGHILATKSAPYRNGVTLVTRADSNALAFVDRNTGRTDTIAMLRQRPQRIAVQMDSLGRARSVMPSATEPNAQAEFAQLFFDGWLAVVRLEPLRVDWRSPSGQWTHGAAIPLKPLPVDARERKAIEDRRAESREIYKQNGLPVPPALAMPATLPANTTISKTLPDGRLLIKRTVTASNPVVRYLVINRKGAIDGEIVLAANEEYVGFGEKSIYISFKDDDDLQRLRRHPWP